MRRKIGLPVMLTLIALATTGCVTTGSTGIAPGISSAKLLKARCEGWQPLTYSAKGDTDITKTGIRKHNRFGQKRKCWK